MAAIEDLALAFNFLEIRSGNLNVLSCILTLSSDEHVIVRGKSFKYRF
jgi:hypothetical protein